MSQPWFQINKRGLTYNWWLIVFLVYNQFQPIFCSVPGAVDFTLDTHRLDRWSRSLAWRWQLTTWLGADDTGLIRVDSKIESANDDRSEPLQTFENYNVNIFKQSFIAIQNMSTMIVNISNALDLYHVFAKLSHQSILNKILNCLL